jgi:hypothetical protein
VGQSPCQRGADRKNSAPSRRRALPQRASFAGNERLRVFVALLHPNRWRRDRGTPLAAEVPGAAVPPPGAVTVLTTVNIIRSPCRHERVHITRTLAPSSHRSCADGGGRGLRDWEALTTERQETLVKP